MIQEKLKELELQLNYVCYDKELITRLSKVWDAYYDLKGEVEKLNIPAVIKCDHNYKQYEDGNCNAKLRCTKCKHIL